MTNILTETIERNTNTNNIWKGSIFESLTQESSDTRGRWGEDFLQTLIKDVTDFEVEWDGDSNDKKKQKQRNTWQHENIYEENKWDKLLLLDIEPNGFYITCINHNDMCFGDERHPILKKKSTRHLSAWKFDTSNAVLKRGIENGYSTYVFVDDFKNGTYKEQLREYFERHFV